MTKDTLKAFIHDLDTAFKLRDEQFRMIRMIQLDSSVVERSALPGMESEKRARLEENKAAAVQADETFRVVDRYITQIAGKLDIEEAYQLLLRAKHAFNRLLEAESAIANVDVLQSIVAEDDEHAQVELPRMAETAARDLSAISSLIDTLIPSEYKPF